MSFKGDELGYDKTSKDSILSFASRLTGKSLRELVEFVGGDESGFVFNKGSLGNLVERHYFRHNPPNDHEPDFPDAHLELKTTGVLRDRGTPGGYKAKERLVLGMINYHKIVSESWPESGILRKCEWMLLLFYLFEKNENPLSMKFILPPMLLEGLAKIDEDKNQIRQDWLDIQNAVCEGRAHELSEGATKYLGACTKSANGSKLTSQPNSPFPAKPRAFSLKQGYLTSLIASHQPGFISFLDTGPSNLESEVKRRFRKFIGMSEKELAESLGVAFWKVKPKNFYKTLVNRILVGADGEPLELLKAGIVVKTVRLEKNNKPKESMSFASFDFLEIHQQQWEESELLALLEQRFMFVIFDSSDDDQYRLNRVVFWSMPPEDLVEVESVWKKTKRLVGQGDYKNFPKSSENRIAHVRPHGKNAQDTNPTPQGGRETKRSFWLNRSYISQIVQLDNPV